MKRLFSINGDNKKEIRVFEAGEDYPCHHDPDIPFPLLNQIQSCFKDNYSPERHCIVDSGTGTGKTPLAYIAARHFLDEGKKVIMLAPAKELVKSLYRESIEIWGRKIVGVCTGNDKDIEGKFFIVATPEGYIASVRTNKEWSRGASLLIVDEAHNITDMTRGGDIDVAITLFVEKGGKVMLMSGTFVNKDEMVRLLGADLFVSKYSPTKIIVKEIHAPDDFEAAVAPKRIPPNAHTTISGHVFNRESVRLRLLKDILKKHEDLSTLIFVPTKVIGYCLGESLVCPFHNADLEEKLKDKLVADFRANIIKRLISTNTLSQGVNTPADMVIIFGTRRGGFYLDYSDFRQMAGRAGRGKPEALVYLIGDRIELFNAKKSAISKSLPLPVESMSLTVLCQRHCGKSEICRMLCKTYAASFYSKEKIEESVSRYLRFLHSCNLLNEKEGDYSLTKEGVLLARYYLSPKMYMGYIKLARKLAEAPFSDVEKGCILLSCILQNGYSKECPPRFEKDFLMRLISLELDKEVSAARTGLLKYYIERPMQIPPVFVYQIRDVERWIGMFTDLEKYGVHQQVPGKEWVSKAVVSLKSSAAKSAGRKKHAPLLF